MADLIEIVEQRSVIDIVQGGPRGAVGPQGLKGDQGDKGDKGDKGDRGLDGVQPAQLGTSLGETTVGEDGSLSISFSSPWGIGADGYPYYDSDGAAVGEEAVLIVGSDGNLYIVKPGE